MPRRADIPTVPRCDSEEIIKNGSIHNGKRKFSCNECRHHFIENLSNKIIPQRIRNCVDNATF
ncbi:MAG: IS1/IS1595 family N-terminal zinc-binding domain-containing protein [Candidatus Electronema sp. VV]